VLNRTERKRRRSDIGENKMLKDFYSWGKKGDGTIGSTEVQGFARFGYRDDVGSLPDRREDSMVYGKIKEFSKIRGAKGA
jgi:hypothetical protein